MNAQRSGLPQSKLAHRPRFPAVRLLAGLVAAAGLHGGCSPTPAPTKGQLVLSVQTDMSVPQDVDHIGLEISAGGNQVFDNGYSLGPGKLTLPATMTIVAGKTPAPPVHIRLVARRTGDLRTIREAVTTVPADRTALLRMPIQWLCEGFATEPAAGQLELECPDGQTCMAGKCESTVVDSSELVTYAPEWVFGGGSGAGDGSCLDTISCFSEGYETPVEDSPCSIEKPRGGVGINVALVLPPQPNSRGICGPAACLIPLDAHSKEGWQDEGTRLQLPEAACKHLREGKILAVAVTTACETKTAAVPTCGPWSSVTKDPGEFDAGAPDAGTGGSPTYGVPGQSCAGMTGTECKGKSCCENISVSGGTFPMGRSASGTDLYAGGDPEEQPEHNVTVSDFNLDMYEVTVGRFRKFAEQYDGTPPPVGAGAHPLIVGSGWQAAWDGELPASQAHLMSKLTCDAAHPTWTDEAGANETKPISCATWYESFAFCAWDGGRLPTEAEWEYASAGGTDNRLYPWGHEVPDNTRASYGGPDIAPVGSFGAGAGRWGHQDLAGNMYEWVFDWHDAGWYGGGGSICSDCANTSASSDRVIRGGNFLGNATLLRAAYRNTGSPDARKSDIGFRCARPPNSMVRVSHTAIRPKWPRKIN